MNSGFSASVALCAAGVLSAASWNPSVARAANMYLPFEGEKTTWHEGFERFDYVMEEQSFSITPFKRPEGETFAVGNPAKGQRRCIVVVPKKIAPGHPWSWQGCYWDHEPQTEVELLRRGFHIAFITPDPGKQWDAWYDWLTVKHDLSKKPAFVGMSRGGVNEYDWTTANPDKVSCIYADNPAIRPEAFAKLGELARNDVALLNICGSADSLLQRHTLPIEDRYQQLGGRITVMIKDGAAHHPHSLKNPKLIADWIVEHTQPATGARPDFADEKFIKSYLLHHLADTPVEAANEALQSLLAIRDLLRARPSGEHPLDAGLFYEPLTRVLAQPKSPALLAGGVTGLLFGDGRIGEAELIKFLAGSLNASSAQAGDQTAFLIGLLRACRELAWRMPGLAQAVEKLLAAWSEDEFTQRIPHLRMAFADLTPREADQVAGVVAQLHGGEKIGVLYRPDLSEAEVLAAVRVNALVRKALTEDGLGSWMETTAAAPNEEVKA